MSAKSILIISRYTVSNLMHFLRHSAGWKHPPKTSIAGAGKDMDFKFGGRFTAKQKPIKNYGAKGVWVYPGTAQIF